MQARGHPVRDAVRDRSSLSGSGTGQNHHRTMQGLGSCTLLGVESVKNLLRGHSGILASITHTVAGTVGPWLR